MKPIVLLSHNGKDYFFCKKIVQQELKELESYLTKPAVYFSISFRKRYPSYIFLGAGDSNDDRINKFIEDEMWQNHLTIMSLKFLEEH